MRAAAYRRIAPLLAGPLLWLLAAAGPVGAAPVDVTQRVRATGLAPVEGGDIAAAVDEARRAALRQAVEQGVGVLVTSTTRVRDFAVIDDRILSGTRGYVRSFDVVEQHVDGEGGCHVTVDAVVDMGRLQGDLAALELAAVGAGLPRVACVASEHVDGDPVSWGVVDAGLHEIVAGMTDLLDVQVVDGAVDSQAVDVVVRARAHVAPTTAPIPLAGGRRVDASGLSTASATLRVDVGWVDVGRPVGILQGTGRSAGASFRAAGEAALRAALASVSDSLRALLAEDLRRRAFSWRLVDLVVESPRVVADLAGLTRDVESGLGPVQELTAQRVEGPTVRYRVRSSSGAFELARSLSARGMGEAAVEILQVTPNSLRVALHETADAAP